MHVPKDSTELVRLGLQDLGDGSPTKLANALKLGANGYQKVNRWLKGSDPSYADTVTLLERLGLLNTREDAVAVLDLSSPARLAELAATEADVAAGVSMLLQGQDVLQSQLARLEAQLDAALASPKRRRGSGPAAR